ncbi:Tenascin-X [Trichinella papuae]|uniref:Tenascin-X n=1 Tax=Trichinella papuae TaxID=268474 RepID=A0A0V1N659_9BILA|nr:Tenascin-X [Trichinella papuae]
MDVFLAENFHNFKKACKTHKQCPGQSICVKRKCKLAAPSRRYSECQTQKHCGYGSYCKFGLCWIERDPSSEEEDHAKCKVHEDCPGNKLCNKYGECKPGRPTSNTCEDDYSCDEGEYCKYNFCWVYSNEENSKFDAKIIDENRCETHEECMAKTVCENGKCKPAKPIDRSCTIDKNSCDKHSDCPGQAICDDGKCVPAKPVGGECKTDSDCNESKKQACISGICMAKAVSDKKEEKCTNHYDCSGQRVCKNAKCVPAYSTSKTCSNPGGCPLEQKCAYGYCFEAYDPSNPSKPPPPSEPSSDKCTVNEDCPGSALCKNGQCKTAIMLGKIQCTTDSQCGKNGGCKNGFCYFYIPNYKICKTHSECEGNFLCLNYVCVPAFTWGVHCDKFQSCPPKHICKNGKCYFFLF